MTEEQAAHALVWMGARYTVSADGKNIRRKVFRNGVAHWRTIRHGTNEHVSVWLAWKRRPA